MSGATNKNSSGRGTTRVGRERCETLTGEGDRVLDIIASAYTLEQWAAFLKVPLQHAVVQGDEALCQKLVQAGAEIGSSLHAAVRGDYGEIVQLLLESGAPTDSKDEHGFTALHNAAGCGRLEMARSLLLKGAKKDALGKGRKTPLHLAAKSGSVALVELLLIAGANVTLRAEPGGLSPLHFGAGDGHVDVLKLLIYRGVDVDAASSKHGVTALHIAAHNNKTGAIDVLLEAAANIEARSSRGCTPVHFAVGRSLSLEAARCLLKHGADVNVQSSPGSTPLHIAARHAGRAGAAKIVDLLLRWGADETIANKEGKKAADVIGVDTEEDLRLTDDMERVRKLLENAPADRVWRRRALPLLCRAHPGRVPLSCSWIGLVVTVAELGEEDIFRKIVGYL